jgi:hypothetical protein
MTNRARPTEQACSRCPHTLADHLAYNDSGLLTVRADRAVAFRCTECTCRFDGAFAAEPRSEEASS